MRTLTIRITCAAAAALVLGAGLAACSPLSQDESVPETPPVAGNVREYEYNVELAECLSRAGWDVEIDGVGGWGIVANVPPEQNAHYGTARQTCHDEIGLKLYDVDSESVNYSYDNSVRVSQCLDDKGYATPDPPSREDYVNKTLEDPSAAIWDPYVLVAEAGLRAAITSCPK